MDKDNIEVKVGTQEGNNDKYAIVQDRVSGRAWSGEGKTESEATTQAVKKFLGDRRSNEYVNTKG